MVINIDLKLQKDYLLNSFFGKTLFHYPIPIKVKYKSKNFTERYLKEQPYGIKYN